jgi:hypothetical protein
MTVIEEYRNWKIEHQDIDYQYNEIHEFVAGIKRGELYEFFEEIENLYMKNGLTAIRHK